MKHEFHIGGVVRSDAPVPVLMARGLCGLLAAQRLRNPVPAPAPREGVGG